MTDLPVCGNIARYPFVSKTMRCKGPWGWTSYIERARDEKTGGPVNVLPLPELIYRPENTIRVNKAPAE